MALGCVDPGCKESARPDTQSTMGHGGFSTPCTTRAGMMSWFFIALPVVSQSTRDATGLASRPSTQILNRVKTASFHHRPKQN